MYTLSPAHHLTQYVHLVRFQFNGVDNFCSERRSLVGSCALDLVGEARVNINHRQRRCRHHCQHHQSSSMFVLADLRIFYRYSQEGDYEDFTEFFWSTKFWPFSEEVFLLMPSLTGEMILFTFSEQTSEINVKNSVKSGQKGGWNSREMRIVWFLLWCWKRSLTVTIIIEAGKKRIF